MPSSSSRKIPLFPLANVVLFPDARVPLSARELIILLWNGDPERAQMAKDWRRVA